MTGRELLVSALSGGLAGSALTLISQSIKQARNRPVINLLFDHSEPGCLVDTSTRSTDQVVQRYLRIKVRNSGRSTAQEVSLSVTRIKFDAPGMGTRTFEEEVLDLKLGLGPAARSVFRLAPGAHQYVDLAHTQLLPSGVAEYLLDFVRTSARLTRLGFGAGTYRATIFASAKNASSASRDVIWTWDGGFPGLQITGITFPT
jgi:hypothetical protein